MTLAQFALALILVVSPWERAPRVHGWPELEGARLARLELVAVAIAAASTDDADVVDLVAVALHESAFAPDVDAGRCIRRPPSRCDYGRAVSVWQLQERDRALRERYRTDRAAAAVEALRRIRSSRVSCRHLARPLWLSVYAAGACARGHLASADLTRYVDRVAAAGWRIRHPPATASR